MGDEEAGELEEYAGGATDDEATGDDAGALVPYVGAADVGALLE